MPDHSELLFAYGTLLPNQGNHRRITEHVHSARPGTTRGVLVDLGAFPALIHGEGIVKGMVLAVDDEAIRITDYIEGYRPDGGRSLYIREKVEVDLGDGEIVEGWTYFFADPVSIQARPLLCAGDADGLPIYSWIAE